MEECGSAATGGEREGERERERERSWDDARYLCKREGKESLQRTSSIIQNIETMFDASWDVLKQVCQQVVA